MRKCPFCGKEVRFEYPYLTQLGDDGFDFFHSCSNTADKLNVVVSIYGDSEEEIIAKWEGDYFAEEHKNESV